jgi:hypothetical protein
VTNTLAYFGTELIRAVEKFYDMSTGSQVFKTFTGVILFVDKIECI